MNRLVVSILVLFISLLISFTLKIIIIIRQKFIHKHCCYLCFACKYRYECDDFLGRY